MLSISSKGIDLIKSFEGLRLESYPDPGTGGEPITIGYGHTGPEVKLGQSITFAEAERLLRNDLRRFEKGVNDLFEFVEIGQNTFDALVSFAFNCGLGALDTSTLRKRIMKGEDPYSVLPEELPKWVKAGSKVLPGLVKRRKAEVLLAQQDGPREKEESTAPEAASQIKLKDFFAYFKSEPQQVKAAIMLHEEIERLAPQLLRSDAAWVKEYRHKKSSICELPVAYQYQLDSKTRHGGRMCFSSTNAMLVEYLKPGRLRGEQEDDTYLQTVLKYGDTTSAEAQVSALKAYGINASFRMDGRVQKIKEIVSSGMPVPVGVLHHDHYSNPSGGHWVLIVGFDESKSQWICHDPYGKMNVVHGGYISNLPLAGRFVRYEYGPFNRRWAVAGDGDGWYLEVKS